PSTGTSASGRKRRRARHGPTFTRPRPGTRPGSRGRPAPRPGRPPAAETVRACEVRCGGRGSMSRPGRLPAGRRAASAECYHLHSAPAAPAGPWVPRPPRPPGRQVLRRTPANKVLAKPSGPEGEAAGKARSTTRSPLPRARMRGGRDGGVAFLVDVELLDHARGDSRHIVADRESNPLVAGREEQLDVVAEVAGEDPLE